MSDLASAIRLALLAERRFNRSRVVDGVFTSRQNPEDYITGHVAVQRALAEREKAAADRAVAEMAERESDAYKKGWADRGDAIFAALDALASPAEAE